MKRRLVRAYGTIRIGDPAEPSTVMGPLIHANAVRDFRHALEIAVQQGGRILHGGKVPTAGLLRRADAGRGAAHMPITCEETFAPIPLLFEFETLDEAIAMHNAVPQGLSSAISPRPALGREVPLGRRLGLRHRQRQHRHLGSRDRRRLRRREGDRRRPRGRLRRLEGLHAPPDLHAQLRHRPAAGPGVHFDL